MLQYCFWWNTKLFFTAPEFMHLINCFDFSFPYFGQYQIGLLYGFHINHYHMWSFVLYWYMSGIIHTRYSDVCYQIIMAIVTAF